MKILRYVSKQDEIIEYLEKIMKDVREKNIDNFMICFKDKKNKEMCTGYYNLDMGQRMECVGHIQADIIDQMISENIDKYIEIVEV